jgi:hypothetical protein
MSSVKKKNNEDIYNVSTYSDVELFDILDLFNPSDRELEAQIILMINKYKNMQNDSGDKLAQFFIDIYNHFFDTEDSEVSNAIFEGNENMNDEPITISMDSDTNSKNDEMKNVMQMGNIEAPTTASVGFTKSLEYAQDKLNPLLSQTIKRVISIDSQYRDNKKSLTTEFTFNLSDPLRDVVSLKLYSIQIPYTWYTISNSFGSNFFYIKGTVPGIMENANQEFIIDISAGNYDPTGLVSTINESINKKKLIYSDVDFGNTQVLYNSYTSFSSIIVDISKKYSENSYYIEFSNWNTPNLEDALRVNSIPGFLGFNYTRYDFNTLGSIRTFPTYDKTNISQADTTKTFTIDFTNNYVSIIKYNATFDNYTGLLNEYINGYTGVDLSFNIYLSLNSTITGQKYSRFEIFNDFSNQLFNNSYLSSETYIIRENISDSNVIGYGNSYFKIKLKPNRFTTKNIENSKILLNFPYESSSTTALNIWTGQSSCFGFVNNSNEMNNILSETQSVNQTNTYVIKYSPSINITCTNPYFKSTINDSTVTIATSTDLGYTIQEYVTAINTGIINATKIKSLLNGPPSDSYTYSYNPFINPQYTYSYIDTNDTFNLYLNINKSFNQDNYILDLSNTFLYNKLNIGSTIVNPYLTGGDETTITGYINNNVLVKSSGLIPIVDASYTSIYLSNANFNESIQIKYIDNSWNLIGNLYTVTEDTYYITGNTFSVPGNSILLSGNLITVDNNSYSITDSSLNIISNTITIPSSTFSINDSILSVSGSNLSAYGNSWVLQGNVWTVNPINNIWTINGNTFLNDKNNYSVSGNTFTVSSNLSVYPNANVFITGNSLLLSGTDYTALGNSISFTGNTWNASGYKIRLADNYWYINCSTMTLYDRFYINGNSLYIYGNSINASSSNTFTITGSMQVDGNFFTANCSSLSLYGNIYNLYGNTAIVSGNSLSINGNIIYSAGNIISVASTTLNIISDTYKLIGTTFSISGKSLSLSSTSFTATNVTSITGDNFILATNYLNIPNGTLITSGNYLSLSRNNLVVSDEIWSITTNSLIKQSNLITFNSLPTAIYSSKYLIPNDNTLSVNNSGIHISGNTINTYGNAITINGNDLRTTSTTWNLTSSSLYVVGNIYNAYANLVSVENNKWYITANTITSNNLITISLNLSGNTWSIIGNNIIIHNESSTFKLTENTITGGSYSEVVNNYAITGKFDGNTYSILSVNENKNILINGFSWTLDGTLQYITGTDMILYANDSFNTSSINNVTGNTIIIGNYIGLPSTDVFLVNGNTLSSTDYTFTMSGDFYTTSSAYTVYGNILTLTGDNVSVICNDITVSGNISNTIYGTINTTGSDIYVDGNISSIYGTSNLIYGNTFTTVGTNYTLSNNNNITIIGNTRNLQNNILDVSGNNYIINNTVMLLTGNNLDINANTIISNYNNVSISGNVYTLTGNIFTASGDNWKMTGNIFNSGSTSWTLTGNSINLYSNNNIVITNSNTVTMAGNLLSIPGNNITSSTNKFTTSSNQFSVTGNIINMTTTSYNKVTTVYDIISNVFVYPADTVTLGDGNFWSINNSFYNLTVKDLSVDRTSLDIRGNELLAYGYSSVSNTYISGKNLLVLGNTYTVIGNTFTAVGKKYTVVRKTINLGSEQSLLTLKTKVNYQNNYLPLTSVISNFSLFSIELPQNSLLLKIYPRFTPSGEVFGNENDISYNVYYRGVTVTLSSIAAIENTLNSAITSYFDPNNTSNLLFTGTPLKLRYNLTNPNSITIDCCFNLLMSKSITNKDYNIQFINAYDTSNNIDETWNKNLQIDVQNYPNQSYLIDTSYSLINRSNLYFISYNSQTRDVTIKGSSPIVTINILLTNQNNYFRIIAYEDGVITNSGANDVLVTIPINDTTGTRIKYSRDSLLNTINTLLSTTIAKGTYFSSITRNGLVYVNIRSNVNRIYKTNDYNIVFYDTISFVRCYTGVTSVRNTTWDTTLGWVLGFRNSTIYVLSENPVDVSGTRILGDTGLSTNLYNYFLICLDDYNQNHLNDGLITIANKETTIPLPAYANKSNYICDPITGELTYNTAISKDNSKLTQNQLYSLTQIQNSKNSTTSSISKNVSTKSYGSGPFAKDIFGIIPMKVAGLANGSTYTEFGGTLQNQERSYFGPVNIHRMTVKLVSDRGDVVDLNGANWSFSLICEQLYKQKPSSSDKK